MFTKSIIQQTVENLQLKNKFKDAITHLMEKYNIEDSVFTFYNNSLHEVVDGYFVTNESYDNLDDAISNCDKNGNMCIRVIGNNFQVGSIHNKIAECDTNKKVFDLKRLQEVR